MLTAAASLLLAISGPGLAASRTQAHRATDANSAFARDMSDNVYTYSPYLNEPWAAPRGAQSGAAPNFSAGRDLPYSGQNLPYPDLPYGNPGSW
jgi:hypothetical protein